MKQNFTALINKETFALVARINMKIEKVSLLMFAKVSPMIILPFILFSILTAPVSGISVSYSYYDESGSISNSQNYNLDDSTLLKSISTFEGCNMQQSLQASGKGRNSMGQQIKGNLYSFENTLSSSGSFGISSSTGASSAGSSLSQSVTGRGESNLGQSVTGEGYELQNTVSNSGLLSDSSLSSASAGSGSLNRKVAGIGDSAFVGSGTQGEDNSGQKASVAAGLMASSYDISAGAGVSSSQSTAIRGEAGSLGSGALSSDNMMLVTGSFEGSGGLDAELHTGAANRASASGKVSVNGGTLIDDSTIQSVGKESIGLNVEGLTATSDGQHGSFDANVVNMDSADGKLAGNGGVSAAQVQTGYNLWTYSGLPMKWTANNPQIQLYLVGNTVSSNLNQNDVSSAISTAANTWDGVVSQQLFAAGTTVKIDNSKQVVPSDGKNTVGANTEGWRALSFNENPNGQTLAITYNWFGAPVNGYYSIQESNTAFNNAQKWSTTGANYDVQSVSLHELGHTIGLDHISDPNQIMNPTYTGKRVLGSGDIAGAQVLYGAVLPSSGGSGGYSFSAIN